MHDADESVDAQAVAVNRVIQVLADDAINLGELYSPAAYIGPIQIESAAAVQFTVSDSSDEGDPNNNLAMTIGATSFSYTAGPSNDSTFDYSGVTFASYTYVGPQYNGVDVTVTGSPADRIRAFSN